MRTTHLLTAALVFALAACAGGAPRRPSAQQDKALAEDRCARAERQGLPPPASCPVDGTAASRNGGVDPSSLPTLPTMPSLPSPMGGRLPGGLIR